MIEATKFEALIEKDVKNFRVILRYKNRYCEGNYLFKKTFETEEEAEKYAERVMDYVVLGVGKGVVDMKLLEKFLETCP